MSTLQVGDERDLFGLGEGDDGDELDGLAEFGAAFGIPGGAAGAMQRVMGDEAIRSKFAAFRRQRALSKVKDRTKFYQAGLLWDTIGLRAVQGGAVLVQVPLYSGPVGSALGIGGILKGYPQTNLVQAGQLEAGRVFRAVRHGFKLRCVKRVEGSENVDPTTETQILDDMNALLHESCAFLSIGAIQMFPLGPLAYFLTPGIVKTCWETEGGKVPVFRAEANALSCGWDAAFPLRPAREIRDGVQFGITIQFTQGLTWVSETGTEFEIQHAFAGQDSKFISTVG